MEIECKIEFNGLAEQSTWNKNAKYSLFPKYVLSLVLFSTWLSLSGSSYSNDHLFRYDPTDVVQPDTSGLVCKVMGNLFSQL